MGHFENSNIKPASPIVFKSGVPISVICVASTFTGVTYANNGGKVQLVSAGVHGLTTSPAVGASVYVSWAGGTGVSGLYNVLSVDDTLKFTIDLAHAAGLGTPTVAVANTEITVCTFSCPALAANSLVENMVLVKGNGSASTKIPRVRFDGNMINFFVTTTGATIRVDGYFKNINATNSQISTSNVAPQSNSSSTISPQSFETAAPKPITVTFQNTAANDVCIIYAAIIKVTI